MLRRSGLLASRSDLNKSPAMAALPSSHLHRCEQEQQSPRISPHHPPPPSHVHRCEQGQPSPLFSHPPAPPPPPDPWASEGEGGEGGEGEGWAGEGWEEAAAAQGRDLARSPAQSRAICRSRRGSGGVGGGESPAISPRISRNLRISRRRSGWRRGRGGGGSSCRLAEIGRDRTRLDEIGRDSAVNRRRSSSGRVLSLRRGEEDAGRGLEV